MHVNKSYDDAKFTYIVHPRMCMEMRLIPVDHLSIVLREEFCVMRLEFLR